MVTEIHSFKKHAIFCKVSRWGRNGGGGGGGGGGAGLIRGTLRYSANKSYRIIGVHKLLSIDAKHSELCHGSELFKMWSGSSRLGQLCM